MEKIKISFISHGDLAATLMHANFVRHFQQKFQIIDTEINFYSIKHLTASQSIFYRQMGYIKVLSHADIVKDEEADALINLQLYPIPIYLSRKILDNAKPIVDIFNYWSRYIYENKLRSYLIEHTECNWNVIQDSIIKGRNFINMLDIGNRIGISRDDILPIYLQKEQIKALARLGIGMRKFVTLYNGRPDTLKSCTRSWPDEYYNKLVELLKCQYPDLCFIQIGESRKIAQTIMGVDLDLRGKIDFEDLKVILKNALLHIEAEGSVAFLRRALRGGTSVVFWGPTPVEFGGCDGDINLRSKICPQPCARLIDEWADRCAAGQEKPSCMYGITPETVFENIKNFFDNRGQIKHRCGGLEKSLADRGWTVNTKWLNNFLQDKILLRYEFDEEKLFNLLRRQRISTINGEGMKIHEDQFVVQRGYQDSAITDMSNSRPYVIMNGRNDAIIYEDCELAQLYEQYEYNYNIDILKIWIVEQPQNN